MATINIQVHKWGKPNGFRKRQCWPTRSKHFAITRQIISGTSNYRAYKNFYAITHIKTGISAFKYFRSVRHAQLIAAALDKLPMKWGTLTLKNAEDRKKQLDPSILKWFGALTNNVPARGEAEVTDAH